MAQQDLLLTIITFLPVAGGLALLLLESNDHAWIRRLALATALAEFAISLLLLRGFDPAFPGYQFVEKRAWINTPEINYFVGLDGLSLWLVLLATFLTPVAMLASWKSIHHNVKGFFLMLLLLETGMVGVFISLDLFLFFVFWEVMLIPMYFLIGVWGHERRIYAAVKFVLYTMAGSVLMLVAILWLQQIAGTFSLPEIQAALQAGQVRLPAATEQLLFLAFFVAFAIKVPLFPFHTWLPDAHVEAPAAGSVILAGVLLKMGTYGMLRFCLPLFPEASVDFAPYIGALAVIGVIYGALVAMVQPDFKKLVAYSSVSHLGMVVLGIFAFNEIGIQGAIYQMLNHGISTGALFLVAGMLYDRRHTHLISEFGGLVTPMPKLSAFFMVVTLSSIGLPMLNGFVGEFLILNGTWQANRWWAASAATVVIFSAVYMLWAYQRVIFGSVTNEKNRTLPDVDPRERGVLVVMCALILLMGVASPIFTQRTETAARLVIRQMDRPTQAYEAKRANAKPAVVIPSSPATSEESRLRTRAESGVKPPPSKSGEVR